MPGVVDANISDSRSSPRVKAELVKLWLPSELDAKDRGSICFIGVVDSEKDLRFAQLEDALDDLRRTRRIRYGLITYHKIQLTGEGQRTQTKSRAVVQTIEDWIGKCARRYRVARDALLRLDPRGDWRDLYLPLTEGDNRGPGKEPEEVPGSDGRYVPSWIWRSSTTVVSPDEVNEDMRVEWAQCVARAERWREEVILLQEEMRRVVQFLEWRSNDWLAKADLRTDEITPAVHAGLSAYAKKQGPTSRNLAVWFSQRWRSVLVSLSFPHAWATRFLNARKEPLDNPDFKKRKQAERPPVTRACAAPPPSVTPPADLPPADLPPVDLPPVDLTPVDLPPVDLPPVDLPPVDLPPVDLPPVDLPPTTAGTIHRKTQASNINSDESSSEDDESEYDSTSSWAE